MRNGLVSVIIPVFNVAVFLPKSIESLLAQSYRNFELLLVDDGSTDESAQICDRFAKLDSRIRVWHKPNGGVSSARNLGLRMAQGQFIAFTDPDDYVEPNYLEIMIHQIQKQKADAVLCGYAEHQSESKTLVYQPVKTGLGTGADALYWCWKRDGYFTSLWNKLFRRCAIETDGALPAFDTDLQVGEDDLWLVKVFSKMERVWFEPTALYHWIWRESSALHKAEKNAVESGVLDSMERIIRCVQEYSAEHVSFAKARFYNIISDYAIWAYCGGSKTEFQLLRRKISPFFWTWLSSGEITPMRKIKLCIINFFVVLHAPEKLVYFLFMVKRK